MRAQAGGNQSMELLREPDWPLMMTLRAKDHPCFLAPLWACQKFSLQSQDAAL